MNFERSKWKRHIEYTPVASELEFQPQRSSGGNRKLPPAHGKQKTSCQLLSAIYAGYAAVCADIPVWLQHGERVVCLFSLVFLRQQ